MEKKISLASNLSYNLSYTIRFFYDSSFTLENNSLKNILYEFESNIKKNNMGMLLGNDITNDLSILFKELSINPSDSNISVEINKILSVYWK